MSWRLEFLRPSRAQTHDAWRDDVKTCDVRRFVARALLAFDRSESIIREVNTVIYGPRPAERPLVRARQSHQRNWYLNCRWITFQIYNYHLSYRINHVQMSTIDSITHQYVIGKIVAWVMSSVPSLSLSISFFHRCHTACCPSSSRQSRRCQIASSQAHPLPFSRKQNLFMQLNLSMAISLW